MKRQLQLAQIKSELLCCASHNIESVQCLTTSNTSVNTQTSLYLQHSLLLRNTFGAIALKDLRISKED